MSLTVCTAKILHSFPTKKTRTRIWQKSRFFFSVSYKREFFLTKHLEIFLKLILLNSIWLVEGVDIELISEKIKNKIQNLYWYSSSRCTNKSSKVMNNNVRTKDQKCKPIHKKKRKNVFLNFKLCKKMVLMSGTTLGGKVFSFYFLMILFQCSFFFFSFLVL